MDKRLKERKSKKAFWHHFDRWALLLVVVLQAGILLSYRLRQRTAEAVEPTADRQPTHSETCDDDCAMAASTSRSKSRAVATTPVCYDNALRAPLSVDSASLKATWQVLRRSPALDIADRVDFFEVRLSVPEGVGQAALARVEGRQLQIEVPAVGGDTRILRRVQLPSAPATDSPPRLVFTNGILRIVVSK